MVEVEEDVLVVEVVSVAGAMFVVEVEIGWRWLAAVSEREREVVVVMADGGVAFDEVKDDVTAPAFEPAEAIEAEIGADMTTVDEESVLCSS